MRHTPLPANALALPELNREAIEAHIEKLINMLDQMDGDADFEPWLGSSQGLRLEDANQDEWAQTALRGNPLHDLEDQCDDEGATY